jgi:glycosyltransferase involved in cell wall biosynthesis
MINHYIFVSSEDDKYRVAGGIGTYIGLLSRTIKQVSPKTKVSWFTLSAGKPFNETDEYGVHRIYLDHSHQIKRTPFATHLKQHGLIDHLVFQEKITDKVLECINPKEKTILEIGEWEGHGAELFRKINHKNVLKVARIHTPLATCIKQNNLETTPENALQLWSEYATLSNADVLSACTKHVKERLEKDVIGKTLLNPIKVLPNPIDDSKFGETKTNKKKIFAYLNKKIGSSLVSDNTFNIFVLGSVESRKGVEMIIDAIPKIASTIRNARICFIGHHGGDGENLTANSKIPPKQLLKRIEKRFHSHIGFTGYVDHKKLPEIISAGDIFPIMSLGDNFPGTVAEISLSSKPIISLARGGVKEMISNKNTVVAYNIGRNLKNAPARLAQAVIKLHNNPDKMNEVGKALNKLMRRKYNSQTVAKTLLRYYENELNRKV